MRKVNTIKRYRVIACEIMFREISFCAAKCKNIVDITFMSKGLHDIGQIKMSEALQQAIDEINSSEYDAILLAYGLCNNGITGLKSSLPIVVPRAHDCITLLMGSRDRYQEYFNNNPGTYFKSTGWVEREKSIGANGQNMMNQLGMNNTYQEYVELYGEENALYLMETLGDWTSHYKKMAYIDTQVGDFSHYKQISKSQAAEKGWDYEEVEGSTSLLMKLLDGEWGEEDFLFVPALHQIEATHRSDIIKVIDHEGKLIK
ncbi:MAG: hypothetical protein K0S71_1775 [Clostridia bacterium]|jgi:hypothetical protein|nr:hypothetical protein [Clostridia bacterium]